MISWDCACPASEEQSEAGYGMSYTDAAVFWWTLWKNNYEVFAAMAGRPMINSAFRLQTANTARTILGSYYLFEASNVLNDLSEPKDICPSRTSACWKPAHDNASKYAYSRLFPVAPAFTGTGVLALEGQRRDA